MTTLPRLSSSRRLLSLWFAAVLPTFAWAETAPAAANSPAAAGGGTADHPVQMDRVAVTEDRYKAVGPDVARGSLPWLGVRMNPPAELPNVMNQYVVTATRTPQLPERVAATTRILDAATLRATPTLALDQALRSIPSFSLFRRTDSLIANPTAQGVSLRGLGPSGASRSLVLLDGVPLNDPFGGWVNWTQVPRDSVAKAEVVPGGGATAWGNAALGGVVQLFSVPIRTETMIVDRPPAPIAWAQRGTAQATALAGDFDTRSATMIVNRPVGSGILQLSGEDFTTAGFGLVAPERRGPVDVAAWSRHRSVAARWRQPLGPTAELTATVRGFEEFRGNGTPYQRNGTREKLASVQAVAQPTDTFAWNAVAYAQDQSFASTFSAVNATRTAETPASDQYAVPSTAAGVSWTGTWSRADGGQTGIGADARTVHGETRENYSFSAGSFTRERVAGGSQAFAGIFAVHQQPVAAGLRLNAGVRVDDWSDTNGHRHETERATGAALRDDRYDDRHGAELSPGAGFVWRRNGGWRLHGNAQRAFRRPTLNELYRPFRQGANVTEANPALGTEHVNSAEIGADWTLMKQAERTRLGDGRVLSRPARQLLRVGVTGFWNDLRNAVTNVTIARGPGTFPIVGTLPAGGIGRQRLNVDRTRVQGVEASAEWSPLEQLSINANYLFDDATVTRARIAPTLVGKRLAEVPRHSATVAATWRAPGQVTITPRVRWIGRQYDDDENTLRLGEAVVVDLGLSRPLTKNVELFLDLENLGNARVETTRSADGVVSIGTPRLVFGGIRGRW